MANKEHLRLLKRGAAAWNQWRQENPAIAPDLEGINVSRARVGDSDFVGTYRDELNYPRVNFARIDLSSARLSHANLNFADLTAADLSGASLFHAGLNMSMLSGANLSDALVYSADCRSANFSGADLSSARCMGANFGGAKLVKADLSYAELFNANLRGADLSGAILYDSNLGLADFSRAVLVGTQFKSAATGGTIWGDTDLSLAVGLDEIRHAGPSTLGVDTIYKSGGKIPEAFLRGCGIPDSFIIQIPALVAAMQPIQFYSCFISYSSKEQKFAERLHADLQNKGVRCWYAPKDLKIGEEIRVGIDESIRVHDKLLLILSKNSIDSEWVEKEVETAMERERQQRRTILFPIRLDDTVLRVQSGWAADIRRSRNIGDFRRWKSHDVYSKAFGRLLRDLKAETS